jgi:hypothetical protein
MSIWSFETKKEKMTMNISSGNSSKIDGRIGVLIPLVANKSSLSWPLVLREEDDDDDDLRCLFPRGVILELELEEESRRAELLGDWGLERVVAPSTITVKSSNITITV